MSSHDVSSSRRSSEAAPRQGLEKYQRPPAIFDSWISKQWGVAWVISAERKDKRTGVVAPTPANIYLLQYEIMGDDGRLKIKYHGFGADDAEEAIKLADAFMKKQGLGPARRRASKLFHNERSIKVWTEQNESVGSG